MIEFAFIEEREHAAVPSGISTMCIDPTLTVLCEENKQTNSDCYLETPLSSHKVQKRCKFENIYEIFIPLFSHKKRNFLQENKIYIYIYIYIFNICFKITTFLKSGVYIYIYRYINECGGRVYLGIKCSMLW